MTPMEEFIHHETLIIFKRRLADPNITDKQRQMVEGLLARSQARELHEKEDDLERTHTTKTA